MVKDNIITNFIIEARQRGFSDMQIRRALEEKNYPENLVEKSFESLRPKFKIKNQVCIFLSNEVLVELNKRAKKNMLTLPEQIEDILRRSCTRKKASNQQDKIDDLLLTCFSRANRGRK